MPRQALPCGRAPPNNARMLAGLLFATQDADDRPGTLAATLRFGPLTLIEYQTRLLVGLGTSQIIVICARATPELLGAIARIGRRGIAVDAVATAAEAAAKLHPLASLVILADGLVTTEAAVRLLIEGGDDALLVFDDGQAPSVFERIGGRVVWAGVARLAAARLNEVAALPTDYDVQSSLLRVAAQAGAAHVVLAGADVRAGHGVERRGDTLEARGRLVMTSLVASRRGWFDRWVFAPIARPLLVQAMRHGVTTIAVSTGAAALAVGGLVAIYLGYPGSGAIAALAGTIVASSGATLASLRDETTQASGLSAAVFGISALALLLLGHIADQASAQTSGRILAITSIVAAALVERAAVSPHDWWGAPSAYLGVAAVAMIAGWPLVGLGLAAGYAAVSLASAIEALRRDA